MYVKNSPVSVKHWKRCTQKKIGSFFLPRGVHPFNGLFSRTTWVSRYQKDTTSLDLHEARDGGVLG